jgi:hypothetical protein
MSPIAKSLLASLAIALVVAGTISLRGRSAPAAEHPRLTREQLAEIKPQSKPEPPKVSAPVNDPSDLPPPPDDDPEDGNGS